MSEQMPVYGMETLNIFYQKEVHIPSSSEKSNAYTVLLFARNSLKHEEWCLLGCYAMWLL
jgi:hypothetical protein